MKGGQSGCHLGSKGESDMNQGWRGGRKQYVQDLRGQAAELIFPDFNVKPWNCFKEVSENYNHSGCLERIEWKWKSQHANLGFGSNPATR